MKWIPLFEQQPNEGDTVLIAVCPSNKDSDYTILIAVVANIDGKIVFKDKWGFCEVFKSTIDYWMPLPENP